MQQVVRSGRSNSKCHRRVGLVSLVAICFAALGQPPRPTEYDVKAAYLLDFGKFVRRSGPQLSRSSFDICLLGRDPMGHTIDDLAANETIDSRPVHVRRLRDASEAKSCDIVFISSNEADHIREDLAILAGSNSLTVSDTPQFLDLGGMVQFVLIANHVRFAINLNAVNRAHLELSSELLRVASSVTGKPQGDMP